MAGGIDAPPERAGSAATRATAQRARMTGNGRWVTTTSSFDSRIKRVLVEERGNLYGDSVSSLSTSSPQRVDGRRYGERAGNRRRLPGRPDRTDPEGLDGRAAMARGDHLADVDLVAAAIVEIDDQSAVLHR